MNHLISPQTKDPASLAKRLFPIGLLLALGACGASKAPVVAGPPQLAPVPQPCECMPCDAPAAPAALISDGGDTLRLQEADFSDLPGWREDQQSQAMPAFLASCNKLDRLRDDEQVGTGPFGGRARDWRSACAAARLVAIGDDQAAREFFESEFNAYAARGDKSAQGRITGYYVQELRASRKRGGRYQFPLYGRPGDLVGVSLSDFVDDGRSRRIWGRLSPKGKKLLPYPARAQFRKSAAKEVLLWVDSPADAIAVEIEGSGRAILNDGSVVMVAFAGKNGRKSGKLGIIARAMRALEKEHGSGRWSRKDLMRYQSIADQKTSIVFFAIENRQRAIGSQNVMLTPRRSLAVDRAVISLSTPVWVQSRAPSTPDGPLRPFRSLLIAQDTGGAIIGTMRGDIFFGEDRAAMEMGRRVNGPAAMWLLLPRAVQIP